MAPLDRDRRDRCPGVLRPHQAADGAVVRLRVPGGQLPSGSMRALAAVADAHADGGVYLTSRGNLQLRGVTMADGGCTWDLVDAVKAAGLLPSETHELVRNIVASPLTGVSGGLMDVRPALRAIDSGLCGVPAMASLPGRFLFVVDDGRGDVAGMKADLTLVARSAESLELIGGPTFHVREVARVVVDVCARFLEVRGSAWHVAELSAEDAAYVLGVSRLPEMHSALAPQPTGAGVGSFSTHVSVLAPLGRLSSDQLRLLADSAPQLVVTPWRGVVAPGAGAEVLAALEATGLVGEPGSPWTKITACVGRPSCAKAMGDTMAAARALAESQPGLANRVHIVACERACGTPSGPHELVLLQEWK